ncbi:MAG TPA: hypothetical protein PJ982_07660 [Lacipirellulaceae bacterium]|nr:hypothetical protein [Lacipirellulaceae bacterium]
MQQHESQHESQQQASAQPHEGSQAAAQPQLGSQAEAQPHDGSQQPQLGSQQQAALQALRAFSRANRPGFLQHGSQQGSQQHRSAQPQLGSHAAAQPQLGSAAQPQPPSKPKNAEAFEALISAMATPSVDSRELFIGRTPNRTGEVGAASVAVDRLARAPYWWDGADAKYVSGRTVRESTRLTR